MRNEHIKPGDLVPAEIRIQVYEEALRIIRNNEVNPAGNNFYHLCLMLPVLLWGLDSYIENAPNGEEWTCIEIPTMFPEIDSEFITYMSTTALLREQANAKRIEVLQGAILQLMP